MRRTLTLLSNLVAFAAAAPLTAQGNPQCSGFSGQSQTVCNAAFDGTQVFHPVLGLLTSGGNPVIGTARTLGGFFHLSLAARVNATRLRTPDLNFDGSTNTVAEAKNLIAPSPVVEAALGIFRGINNGLLSVDALASAQLLPTTQIDNLTVDPNARKLGSIALGLGYGAKVGISNGRGPIPAISVSAMRRDIPQLTYGKATLTTTDRYRYSVDLQATNLRAMAGYHLAILSVVAGLGWDKYTGTAQASYLDPTDNTTVQTPAALHLDNTRTMIFADAALDFPLVKLAAEAGYQFGKAATLSTTFTGNDPAASRLFASAAVRFSF